MAQSTGWTPRSSKRFTHWLFEGANQTEGPYEQDEEHHTHPWWQVMCLTGVDYFSTLGYQPGIAALAAGSLAPVATLILILLTLFGALPIYRRVAAESPHGEGSIAMLERMLSWWQGKIFVLVLLGFVATDFIITITLSAADATAHIIENPFAPAALHGQEVAITLVLILLLGGVFLRGFKEAIGIAVVLVILYLVLNMVVVIVGAMHVLQQPSLVVDWQRALFTSHGNPVMMVVAALLVFPKLALGLSGFETGVAVMPLVKGGPKDTYAKPETRINNTRKLLLVAALIMSFYLMSSSLVTTILIPPEAFQRGGEANGRALAYLAHLYLGDLFGTLYDISTISILWFAGASAMAGLLNIVPRYLPRYGMAPNWARAARPLVIVFTVIAFVVTILFKADVDAQGGAYATGVLVLMSSAALAVTLFFWHRKEMGRVVIFGLITLVFFYTTVVNIIERPEGLHIASFFIGAIIVVSFVSRIWRSTELRIERVELDEEAQSFIHKLEGKTVRIIANQIDAGDLTEYRHKEREVRADTHMPYTDPVLFFEVVVDDASDFSDTIRVRGIEMEEYHIFRTESPSVANAIAAFLLHIRDMTGTIPHMYFEWAEGNPLIYIARFIVFGDGDIAPTTREILRQAEPDPERRPMIHVGG